MEIIVDIKNAVYKERLVRCRDCRKKRSCITFEGIANENGYCSLGETRDKDETKKEMPEYSPWKEAFENMSDCLRK